MLYVSLNFAQVIGTVPVDKPELTIRLLCRDDGSPALEFGKDVKIVVKETVQVPKKLVLLNQKAVPENSDSFDVGNFQIVNMLTNEAVQGVRCKGHTVLY